MHLPCVKHETLNAGWTPIIGSVPTDKSSCVVFITIYKRHDESSYALVGLYTLEPHLSLAHFPYENDQK